MSEDRDVEDVLETYRRKHQFESSRKISHPQDCYPGNCSLVGYVDDDTLQYQEQTGKYPVVDPDTPDWNPRGCNKQCSYTDATYGEERIEQPMVQTGERGSDNWEPISWQEAYEEIADAVIDAVEEDPQTVVTEMPPGEGGLAYGSSPFRELLMALGGICMDVESATIQDFSAGMYETFGKYHFCSTQDDWFNADVNLLWHINPAYSRIPGYHFLTESRYHGGETVLIAPDVSPSAVHADKYVPVEPASDAALALGMARVMIEEDWVDTDFVREQTDLPLLVRSDTDRFLREADLEAEGSEEKFYLWDEEDGLVQAPRDTLDLGEVQPALEGTHEVSLQDGKTVEVQPVMVRLKRRLKEEYDLEAVQETTGVAPEVVRDLAETVAHNKTSIVNSWNTCKIFHGDLIERAMALVLALSGNWGQSGTGMRSWSVTEQMGLLMAQEEEAAGGTDPMVKWLAREAAEAHDDELTEELVEDAAQKMLASLVRTVVPAHFFWYWHCGYDEVWDEALEDEDLPRKPSEYMEESIEEGWWDGVDYPADDVDPSVFFIVADNALRNKRGTTRTFLETLWPKLDKIVCVDYRWSTTALHSDIVLPAAFHHEKPQFHTLTSPELRFWSFADRAVDNVQGSKNEMEMCEELAQVIERRAAERGLEEYEVPHGLTAELFNEVTGIGDTELGRLRKLPEELDEYLGAHREYSNLYQRLTDRHFSDENVDEYLSQIIDIAQKSGVFTEEDSLESIREEGFAKYEGLGISASGLNQAADVEPDETVVSLSRHREDKDPYPTLTRRAQFYLEHEWFLEADEGLPAHKTPPAIHGGDREQFPFYVTSGHNRHSIHGITLANETQVNTHRGEPHVFINNETARERGIEDGDTVRVFNALGECTLQAKTSTQPAPDQVVIYHGWDPYMFEGGQSFKDMIPGLIKPLHLAGGYGHLEYRFSNWQPQQVGRHICVDLEPA